VTQLPRRVHLLIPVLYALVIGVFVWLQLGTGRTVAQEVSGLRIRAVGDSRADSGTSVRRVTLSYGAAELRFSRLRPLLLGKSRARLRPVACTVTKDGAVVDFRGLGGRSLSVGFRVGPQGALEIAAGPVEALAVPLECPGGSIQGADGVPAIALERGDERLLAVMPPGSRVRWTGGYLYLEGREARLRLAPSSGGSLLMQWLLAQGSLADQAAYEREMRAFRDRAYRGWTQSRYLPDVGLWRGADGRPDYTGRLGSAFLAEATQRGEHARALEMVLRAEGVLAGARPTAERSRETGLFTGDVAGFAAWRAAVDGPRAREAERLLRAADPAAWRAPDLVGLLESEGAQGLLAEAGARSLEGWEPQEADVAIALGVLEASLDAPGTPWLAAAAERALSRVFSALRVDGEGLAVAGVHGADPTLSLRAGSLLVRAGLARGDQAVSGIGWSLVAGVLRAADSEGFAVAPEGRIPAEEVYHRAGMSQYLPSRRPTGGLFGPGVELWSVAPLRSASEAAEEVTLTFAFVPGVPHYVLLRGMPEFAQLRLTGIPWRPDPAFAQYFAGWYYDAAARSLSLKLTQEKAEEPVVIAR
jgi:hypothetical protein